MSQEVLSRKRPNYGLDAPGVVRTFALLGAAGVAAGVALSFALRSVQPTVAVIALHAGLWPGLSWLLTAGTMVWGSKVGKLRECERFLSAIPWRGDELVLDVGCGRGLLLIGAAKRLTTGKATGVDLWQSEDQTGNRPEATWENARMEGVADRIEIKDGDARQLPFADGTFDVVVSSWALHNIYQAAGRQQALREIVRVLKPGGRVALLDIQHTAEYVRGLRECGMSDVERSGPKFLFVLPTYAVRARKPVPSA
jgi:SAM-dependent methyltransferase